MKLTNYLIFTTIIFFFQSCGKDETTDPVITTGPKFNLTVDPSTTYQTITGFGAANGIFDTSIYPDQEETKKAFGTDAEDLGLSIFRIKLPYNPEDWDRLLAPALEAMKYDVKILASPWSPPPGLKNNDSSVRGYLLQENYDDYVDHINAFIEFMESNGVDLYAISIQNEPDWEATYESCDWNATQMSNFLKEYAGDIDERVKVAAPESLNFSQTFTNALLTDEGASANLDIAAGHLYGGGLAPFPLAEEKNKEIWMTEYLLNLNAGDWANANESTKWDESMTMLNTIQDAMKYNWNAYIWWYLKRYYSFIGDGREGTTEGKILKRGIAFSHFSKYIRPGYVRINIESDKTTGLNITAYKGDNKFVVVVINPKSSDLTGVGFSILGKNISTANAYTTTLLLDRSSTEPKITDNTAVVDIKGRSITTIVLDI